MKQLIVLVATIILGLAIGGIVTGFADDAQDVAAAARTSMDKIAASTVTWTNGAGTSGGGN